MGICVSLCDQVDSLRGYAHWLWSSINNLSLSHGWDWNVCGTLLNFVIGVIIYNQYKIGMILC